MSRQPCSKARWNPDSCQKPYSINVCWINVCTHEWMITSWRNKLPRGAWGPQGSKRVPGVSWQAGRAGPGRAAQGRRVLRGRPEWRADSKALASPLSLFLFLSAVSSESSSCFCPAVCCFVPGLDLHAPLGGVGGLSAPQNSAVHALCPCAWTLECTCPSYVHALAPPAALFLHVYMFPSFSFGPFFLCAMQSFLGIPRGQVSAPTPKLAVSEGHRHVSSDDSAIGGIFSLPPPLGALWVRLCQQ